MAGSRGREKLDHRKTKSTGALSSLASARRGRAQRRNAEAHQGPGRARGGSSCRGYDGWTPHPVCRLPHRRSPSDSRHAGQHPRGGRLPMTVDPTRRPGAGKPLRSSRKRLSGVGMRRRVDRLRRLGRWTRHSSSRTRHRAPGKRRPRLELALPEARTPRPPSTLPPSVTRTPHPATGMLQPRDPTPHPATGMPQPRNPTPHPGAGTSRPRNPTLHPATRVRQPRDPSSHPATKTPLPRSTRWRLATGTEHPRDTMPRPENIRRRPADTKPKGDDTKTQRRTRVYDLSPGDPSKCQSQQLGQRVSSWRTLPSEYPEARTRSRAPAQPSPIRELPTCVATARSCPHDPPRAAHPHASARRPGRPSRHRVLRRGARRDGDRALLEQAAGNDLARRSRRGRRDVLGDRGSTRMELGRAIVARRLARGAAAPSRGRGRGLRQDVHGRSHGRLSARRLLRRTHGSRARSLRPPVASHPAARGAVPRGESATQGCVDASGTDGEDGRTLGQRRRGGQGALLTPSPATPPSARSSPRPRRRTPPSPSGTPPPCRSTETATPPSRSSHHPSGM
jgi:hypothetical protein